MDPQQRSALTQQIMDRVFVRLEASGRHVHLTREQALTLFGHDLTPDRPLSQPGQFLAKERVALIGPKGKFSNVAVLGPARSAAQAEISLTDSKILGITPPIRQSGDITGSPGFILTGDLGTVAVQEGVIVAKRHLHLTPESASVWQTGRSFRCRPTPPVPLPLQMWWCGSARILLTGPI